MELTCELICQHICQYWCSLLFTPFGCLARFALMNKYNKRLPGFPLGTFSCNLISCALSGSLGSFLAGEIILFVGMFVDEFSPPFHSTHIFGICLINSMYSIRQPRSRGKPCVNIHDSGVCRIFEHLCNIHCW